MTRARPGAQRGYRVYAADEFFQSLDQADEDQVPVNDVLSARHVATGAERGDGRRALAAIAFGTCVAVGGALVMASVERGGGVRARPRGRGQLSGLVPHLNGTSSAIKDQHARAQGTTLERPTAASREALGMRPRSEHASRHTAASRAGRRRSASKPGPAHPSQPATLALVVSPVRAPEEFGFEG